MYIYTYKGIYICTYKGWINDPIIVSEVLRSMILPSINTGKELSKKDKSSDFYFDRQRKKGINFLRTYTFMYVFMYIYLYMYVYKYIYF
jgi:hypothetical protein